MPITSKGTLYEFAKLFRGRSSAYGVHEPSVEVDESGKRKGKSYTAKGVLTQEVYQAHLSGDAGLGVVPVCEDDKCFFGAIDVDDYSGERSKLVSLIYRNKLPLNPFRSKSGGLHLFLFFPYEAPVAASVVIQILSDYRELLGLPPKTEIFPKQKTVGGGIGNWINLPYFGDSDRALLNPDGRSVPFEDALDYLKERRFGEDYLRRQFDEMPFSDGPPCLQSLFLQGRVVGRNKFMFSVARYYKSKYGEDEFEGYTKDINAAMEAPLPNDELEKTVFTSHKKKDYSYMCSDSPLSEACNKGKCKGRRYGIGNSEVSELSFGELKQYMDEPPRYEWEINGKVLNFFDEGDLIKQLEFQRQCVRLLHVKPSQLKQEAWDAIVNRALKNIRVVQVDIALGMSPGSRFKSYLAEFLTRRAMARDRTDLLFGKVYLDADANEYIFQSPGFMDFLTDTKRFNAYSPQQVGERLRHYGGRTERYFVDKKNPALAVWRLPAEAIQDHVVNTESVSDLAFLDAAGAEEKEEY